MPRRGQGSQGGIAHGSEGALTRGAGASPCLTSSLCPRTLLARAKGRPHSQDPVVPRSSYPPVHCKESRQNLAPQNLSPGALRHVFPSISSARFQDAPGRSHFSLRKTKGCSAAVGLRGRTWGPGDRGECPRERLACTGSHLPIGLHSGPPRGHSWDHVAEKWGSRSQGDCVHRGLSEATLKPIYWAPCTSL